MTWAGHWHGYGPWTGSRDDLAREHVRTPGVPWDTPEAQQFKMQRFLAEPMPPVMTGHWLLRRSQTKRDKTFTDVAEAVNWLKAIYDDRPPMEFSNAARPLDAPEDWTPGRAYLPLESRVAGAEADLPLGNDVVWCYYTRSGGLLHYSVICCPSRQHPDIPCPLGLAGTASDLRLCVSGLVGGRDFGPYLPRVHCEGFNGRCLSASMHGVIDFRTG